MIRTKGDQKLRRTKEWLKLRRKSENATENGGENDMVMLFAENSSRRKRANISLLSLIELRSWEKERAALQSIRMRSSYSYCHHRLYAQILWYTYRDGFDIWQGGVLLGRAESQQRAQFRRQWHQRNILILVCYFGFLNFAFCYCISGMFDFADRFNPFEHFILGFLWMVTMNHWLLVCSV